MKKSAKSNKKSPFKPRFTWSNKDKAGYLYLKPIDYVDYTSSHNQGKYMINFDFKNEDLVGIEILKIKK